MKAAKGLIIGRYSFYVAFIGAYLLTLASTSAQFTISPPTFPVPGIVQLITSNGLPNSTDTVFQASALGSDANWTSVATGSMGQVIFNLPRPNNNVAFYRASRSWNSFYPSFIFGQLWTNQLAATNPIFANIPISTPDVIFIITNGAINFDSSQSTYTVGGFLINSGATIINGLLHTNDNLDNTVMLLTGFVSITNGTTFPVYHDDGVALQIGLGSDGFLANLPGVNQPSQVTYSGPSGTFSFRLFYGECFGSPGILSVDLPLKTFVVPTTGFAAFGFTGGPFNATNGIIYIMDPNTNSITWSLTITNTASWFDATPSSGTLEPGEITNITIGLNSNAYFLTPGIFNESVLLTNLTEMFTTNLQSLLTVFGQPQPTNQTVSLGSAATFSISVPLGVGHFVYQWQLNGTNFGGTITTVAGGGSGGDGGQATNASLKVPSGVAVGTAGNLFIVDSQHNRIRKVDANGIITTVAGNGINGYSGDNGQATNAELNTPLGVAVDTFGNLFVADTFNNRIRKVDASGVITTVAGNGTNGYSGDNGPATNAEFSYAASVAVDTSGNLFIADANNQRVRKVDTAGTITTVAGDGIFNYSGDGGLATNAELATPQGVAVDTAGNLFIADTWNNLIRKVDTNGIITTVAGSDFLALFGISGYSGDGGMATNAELNTPLGVAVDTFGNLFVADTFNNRIRKVDASGVITTVAGNGTAGYSGDNGQATGAKLNTPVSVAVEASGNLFIADEGNGRVREALLFATYPTLILNNVAMNSAGSYTIVITNDYGSATSDSAILTVSP